LTGKKTELLHIMDNRKRAYHLNVNEKFDKLILIPLGGWGDDDKIPVISFEFN